MALEVFQKLGQELGEQPYTGAEPWRQREADIATSEDFHQQYRSPGVYDQHSAEDLSSGNPLTNPLARRAVTPSALTGAGIGAGAGALLSYLLSNKENKKRNALLGALAGTGLGGLGGGYYGYQQNVAPYAQAEERLGEAANWMQSPERSPEDLEQFFQGR